VPFKINLSLFLNHKNAFLNKSLDKNKPLNVIPYWLSIKSNIVATRIAGNNSVFSITPVAEPILFVLLTG